MSVKEQRSVTNNLAQEIADCPFVTYLNDVQLSDGLLTRSIGSAAVIACSDMGLQLPYVCNSTEAPLYIFQNFGHHFIDGGARETIVCLGIEDVIVYGHSCCQFADFLVARQAQKVSDGLPLENLSYGDGVQVGHPRASGKADDILGSENPGRARVLQELQGMIVDPLLSAMAANGNRKLRLHGWFYNSTGNLLEVFDPNEGEFVIAQQHV